MRRLAVVLVAVLASCSHDVAERDHSARHGDVDPATVMGSPSEIHVGPQGAVGQFVAECDYSHSLPDDPIVFPGEPGRSHLHDFFGSRSASAISTVDSLRESETSCDVGADTASYWSPSVFLDGVQIEPRAAIAYYRAGVGVDPSAVADLPDGLAMIAGDQSAVGNQSTNVVGWSCGGSSRRSAEPPLCSPDAPLRVEVTFPDCWNGVDASVEGHRRHVHYSRDGRCPSSHPVAIPQLTFAVIYPLWGDVSSLRLASGAPHTAHADFLNAWDPDRLATEVELCVRRGAVCGISDGRLDN